jgi:hypothetical protein
MCAAAELCCFPSISISPAVMVPRCTNVALPLYNEERKREKPYREDIQEKKIRAA